MFQTLVHSHYCVQNNDLGCIAG